MWYAPRLRHRASRLPLSSRGYWKPSHSIWPNAGNRGHLCYRAVIQLSDYACAWVCTTRRRGASGAPDNWTPPKSALAPPSGVCLRRSPPSACCQAGGLRRQAHQARPVPRQRWALPECGHQRCVQHHAQSSPKRLRQWDSGCRSSPGQDRPGEWAAWQQCLCCLELYCHTVAT